VRIKAKWTHRRDANGLKEMTVHAHVFSAVSDRRYSAIPVHRAGEERFTTRKDLTSGVRVNTQTLCNTSSKRVEAKEYGGSISVLCGIPRTSIAPH
jgi:hypothetical protein